MALSDAFCMLLIRAAGRAEGRGTTFLLLVLQRILVLHLHCGMVLRVTRCQHGGSSTGGNKPPLFAAQPSASQAALTLTLTLAP